MQTALTLYRNNVVDYTVPDGIHYLNINIFNDIEDENHNKIHTVKVTPNNIYQLSIDYTKMYGRYTDDIETITETVELSKDKAYDLILIEDSSVEFYFSNNSTLLNNEIRCVANLTKDLHKIYAEVSSIYLDINNEIPLCSKVKIYDSNTLIYESDYVYSSTIPDITDVSSNLNDKVISLEEFTTVLQDNIDNIIFIYGNIDSIDEHKTAIFLLDNECYVYDPILGFYKFIYTEISNNINCNITKSNAYLIYDGREVISTTGTNLEILVNDNIDNIDPNRILVDTLSIKIDQADILVECISKLEINNNIDSNIDISVPYVIDIDSTIDTMCLYTYDISSSINVKRLFCEANISGTLKIKKSTIKEIYKYNDLEQEYSMQPELNKIEEWLRKDTHNAVADNQLGLIPYKLAFNWEKNATYFINGNYTVSRDYFETVFKISGTSNNIFIHTDDCRFIDGNMIDLYNKGLVQPFMVFINYKFIPWSKLNIVKSDQYVSLLVQGMDKDTIIDDIIIFKLPFLIEYSEDNNEGDMSLLFAFDMDGNFNIGGPIYITSTDPNIRSTYTSGELKYLDLEINRKININKNNVFIFSNISGRYMGDIAYVTGYNQLVSEEYSGANYNVMTIYDLRTNRDRSNTSISNNEYFMKNVFKGNTSFENLDIELLSSKFTFDHNMDTLYHDNVENGLDYIARHNHSLFNPIYEKIKPINIVVYDYETINRNSEIDTDEYRICTLPYDIYEENQYSTHMIIFIDDYFDSELNSTITYGKTGYTFRYKFNPNLKRITTVFFRRVHNELFKVQTNITNINANKCYIPKDEIVIYTSVYDTGSLLFPLNKTISDDGTITIERPEFRDNNHLYIGSKNQFIHACYVMSKEEEDSDTVLDILYDNNDAILIDHSSDINENMLAVPVITDEYDFILENSKAGIDIDNLSALIIKKHTNDIIIINKAELYAGEEFNKLILGNKFKTAYNPDNFILFCNNMYIHPNDYRVILPTLDNQDNVTQAAIYFKFKEDETIRNIDVYYCSAPALNTVKFNGDLIIECIKTMATTVGQSRYRVPYPFDSYLREYDSFFCIIDSQYVDKDRYIIDGDYIEFVNMSDYSKNIGDEILFVFAYYKPDKDEADIFSKNDVGMFNYYTIRTFEETSTITFTPDYHGNIPNDIPHYLFFNTTFIDPTRYSLNNNTITMHGDKKLLENTLVTLVIEANSDDVFENNKLTMDIYEAKAIQNNQRTIDIPVPREYHDSMIVMRNSLLFAPNRYTILPDGQLFINMNDDVLRLDDKLTFYVPRYKQDVPGNVTEEGKQHVITEWLYTRTYAEREVEIPNYYYNFDYSMDNILLFVHGTFYSDNRYKIENGKIVLIHPDDFFVEDSSVVIIVCHNAKNRYKLNYDRRGFIKFQDVKLEISEKQTIVDIPYPEEVFKCDFILSTGETFISEDMYNVNTDDRSITLNSNITPEVYTNNELRYTFVHNNGFSEINKHTQIASVYPRISSIELDSVFTKYVNFNNRVLLIYDGKYIDRKYYNIDNINKKIILSDQIPFEDDPNKTLSIITFYSGNIGNGAVPYLPSTGYFYIDTATVDRNYTNEMMLVFLNGMLVPKTQITNISNSLFKINTDIQTRYNLDIRNCSPLIKELKPRYTRFNDNIDKWEKVLEILKI